MPVSSSRRGFSDEAVLMHDEICLSAAFEIRSCAATAFPLRGRSAVPKDR